jgi:hypothetical protein
VSKKKKQDGLGGLPKMDRLEQELAVQVSTTCAMFSFFLSFDWWLSNLLNVWLIHSSKF